MTRTSAIALPEGMQLLSEGISRLARCMYSGVAGHHTVRVAKKDIGARRQVAAGVRQLEAWKIVSKALDSEALHLFAGEICESDAVGEVRPLSTLEIALFYVPKGRVLRDIPSHTRKASGHNSAVSSIQVQSSLYVLMLSHLEFEEWLAKERAKHRWPSQMKFRNLKRNGRPKRLTEDEVLDFICTTDWQATDGLAQLHGMIGTDHLSIATLRRSVNLIHERTGNPRFALPRRNLRKP